VKGLLFGDKQERSTVPKTSFENPSTTFPRVIERDSYLLAQVTRKVFFTAVG
jgi:hypothetical protein